MTEKMWSGKKKKIIRREQEEEEKKKGWTLKELKIQRQSNKQEA